MSECLAMVGRWWLLVLIIMVIFTWSWPSHLNFFKSGHGSCKLAVPLVPVETACSDSFQKPFHRLFLFLYVHVLWRNYVIWDPCWYYKIRIWFTSRSWFLSYTTLYALTILCWNGHHNHFQSTKFWMENIQLPPVELVLCCFNSQEHTQLYSSQVELSYIANMLW